MADKAQLYAALSATDPEDTKQRLSLCDKILHANPSDAVIRRFKAVALVKAKRWNDAIQHITQAGLQQECVAELAYAQYSLNRAEDARRTIEAIPEGKRNPALRHLEAQLSYKEENYARAAELYGKLQADPTTAEDETTVQEVYSNLLAAIVFTDHATVPQPPEVAPTHEMLFNQACAHLAARELGDALSALTEAETVLRRTAEAEEWEGDALQAELGVLLAQRAVVLALSRQEPVAQHIWESLLSAPGQGGKGGSLSAQATAVACNNLVYLHRSKELFASQRLIKQLRSQPVDSKLTSQQRLVTRFNEAILALHMNQIPKCRQIANELQQQHPSSELPVLALMAAHIKERKPGKAEECAKAFAASVGAANEAAVAPQLLVAEMHLQAQPSNPKAAIRALEGIEGKERYLGLLALLARLHIAQGNAQAALQLLQQVAAGLERRPANPERNRHLLALYRGVADVHLQLQQPKEAAAAYRKAVELDPDNVALVSGLIITLAPLDADSAEKYANRLFSSVAGEEVRTLLSQPGALESIPLPRPRDGRDASPDATSRRRKRGASPNQKDAKDTKEKKDSSKKQPQPQPQQQQAKPPAKGDKKQSAASSATAKKSTEQAPAQPPAKKRKVRHPPKSGVMDGTADPERWLPLRERSYYKPLPRKILQQQQREKDRIRQQVKFDALRALEHKLRVAQKEAQEKATSAAPMDAD